MRRGFTLVELPAVSQRKRGAFTLVELLVVVGIIAILAAVLLPTISTVMARGDAMKARADVRSLNAAWKTYYMEYGRWPVDNADDQLFRSGMPGRQKAGEKDSQSQNNVSTGIVMVVTVMTNIMYPDASLLGGGDTDNRNPICMNFNTKKISFLEYKADATDTTGAFVDPWGRPYRVLFDLNSDGKVYRGGGVGETQVLNNVISWSVGPDGVNSPDDINSWE